MTNDDQLKKMEILSQDLTRLFDQLLDSSEQAESRESIERAKRELAEERRITEEQLVRRTSF